MGYGVHEIDTLTLSLRSGNATPNLFPFIVAYLANPTIGHEIAPTEEFLSFSISLVLQTTHRVLQTGRSDTRSNPTTNALSRCKSSQHRYKLPHRPIHHHHSAHLISLSKRHCHSHPNPQTSNYLRSATRV